MKVRVLVSLIAFSCSLYADAPKTITVQNGIKKNDLVYKKLFMTFYPDEFEVVVNGQVLKPNSQLAINSNELDITYKSTWKTPTGERKSGRRVRYRVPSEQSFVTIRFNGWDATPRLNIEGAEVIGAEENFRG